MKPLNQYLITVSGMTSQGYSVTTQTVIEAVDVYEALRIYRLECERTDPANVSVQPWEGEEDEGEKANDE